MDRVDFGQADGVDFFRRLVERGVAAHHARVAIGQRRQACQCGLLGWTCHGQDVVCEKLPVSTEAGEKRLFNLLSVLLVESLARRFIDSVDRFSSGRIKRRLFGGGIERAVDEREGPAHGFGVWCEPLFAPVIEAFDLRVDRSGHLLDPSSQKRHVALALDWMLRDGAHMPCDRIVRSGHAPQLELARLESELVL